MTKAASVIKRGSPKEVALHEELASVYFSKKESPKREVKKVSVAKRRIPAKVLIPAVSFIILAVSFLVFLNMFYRQDMNILSNEVKNGASVKILEDGKLNRFITKSRDKGISFLWAGAKSKNRFITLNNSSQNSSALSIDFKFPVDISGKTVSMLVKGRRGGEAISFSVRDASRRSYRLESLYLDLKWSTKTILLKGMASTIDLRRVERLRIEYDQPSTAGKKYDVEQGIYIKNITLVKNIT